MGPELAFTTLIAATAVLAATALMAAAAFDRVAIAVDDAPADDDCDAAGPRQIAIEHIDALLPQTQCGQCGYRGCRPYAAAIAQGDAINKCPPGGQTTITALAHRLNLPATALDPSHGAASPVRRVAWIREAECIGCTKCIHACPVDAILGAAGQMHTVIASECTGCDLCVQPCPVDCIDMIPLTGSTDTAHPHARPVPGDPDSAHQTRSGRPAVTAAGKLRGGITLADHRQASLAQAIVTPPWPPRLVMALDQYDGTSALPVVAVGDSVAKGAMIAAATGPLGTHHHAPTSATVAAITDTLPTDAGGGATLSIVLIPDRRDHGGEPRVIHDYRQHAPAALRDCIHRAGIVGLGGGGFPTATKLDTAQPITTLIVNAVECEPYITADTALLREHGGEVLMGIDILAHVLGDPPRLTIGIAADNAPALASLQAATRIHASIPVAIVTVPHRYPAGSEGPLIQLITGREVPRDGRPADIGVLCVNVATVRAVYRAVCRGEPLLSRIITVAGAGCGRPGNYEVLIGTPLDHLLASAGVDARYCPQPLLGGPMTGTRVVDLAMPLGKTSHCVLAPTAAEMPPLPSEQACSRCGLCAQVCPVNLLPQQLLRHARVDGHHALLEHHLFDCIECGACSYVCPSAIPLVATYRNAKARVDAQLQMQPAAARARRRFRYHERRIAEIDAGKRVQRTLRDQSLREARKQPLASSSAIEPAGHASARADAITASAPGAGTDDAKATTAAAAQLVRDAVDRAATAGNPLRDRARRQRTLLTAEDRLQRAEAELAESINTDPPGASRLLSLQARVVTARLQRDDAARKLAALDEGGRKP